MKKISKLTPEQIAYLPKFREDWRSIGLSTKPCDKNNAIASVKKLYSEAGLNEPKVLFFSSPLLCLFARKILISMGESQLRGQLWDQLSGQLSGQLRGQLWDQLRGQLRDQLSGQLSGQLRDQLEDQLEDQLWDHENLFQQLWTIGGLDSFWLAYYEFGRFIGAKYENNDHFNAYIDYAKKCGIMFAYEGFVFVSDRPETISFDAENRLHNENGPSIRFRDGWSVYSWHGQRIPCEWIEEKEKLTAKTALTWHNIEQRRAACEILGWHQILRELDAKIIDTDQDPEIGQLVEVNIPEIGKEKFLRVQCGTGREFALPVPPNMKTALQSNAWTYGFDNPNDFIKPEIRT